MTILETLRQAACEEAANAQIDKDLFCAIVATESGWNPWAVKFEPGWKYFVNVEHFAREARITKDTESMLQATSWGLTQVMGGRARELGWTENLTKLLVPKNALALGAKNIRALMSRYKIQSDIAAAYNAGSVVREINGMYRNIEYVQRIRMNMPGGKFKI